MSTLRRKCWIEPTCISLKLPQMKTKKDLIPEETVQRLPLYLRLINRMLADGQKHFSSTDLAEIPGIKPAQFRKDISYFGTFGTRGVGYNTQELAEAIRSILNLDKRREVVLVGVGNIGTALLNYPGFAKAGFEISLAFDRDPQLIGRKIHQVTIEPAQNLEARVKQEGIKLGIIAVPSRFAQEVANHLVNGGVTGILNFAPALLNVPKGVKVSYVDIGLELGRLFYYL